MTTAIDDLAPHADAPVALRFGLFELNLAEAELRREGRLVRLQHQPFEVLRALVEHPGDLVSREALRQRLWPADVTVDFDQSLNKTVAKLRDALGETAENPRFVQTVPKRGYRFIAPVMLMGPIAATAPMPAPPDDRTLAAGAFPRAPRPGQPWAWIGAAAAVGLAILALRRE